MKKVLFLALALIMALALFGACSKTDGDTIKIGINMELSGELASYGQDTVEGLEMAIDEINAAGGIDGKLIKLVKYDNKSDSAEVTTLATKLMTQDDVIAVLGPATSNNFKAQIPVADENKIPVISGSTTADDVTVDESGVKEYAFRICFNDSYQGTAMANFALSNLSLSKAVVIVDNSNDYSKGLDASFTETFTAGGGSIVAEEAYVRGDTDFNAILTKIKDMDFDVIFIPGYYQEVGLIIKQARALGIDVPILGGDGFDSPTLTDLAGAEAASNIYFSNHYSSLDEDPAVVSFIAAYNDLSGEDPNAFNALGYDLAMFVCDAISRADELTGEAVKDALAATTGFSGVTGTFSVDENHNPVKSIVVIELQNGEQVSSVKAGLE